MCARGGQWPSGSVIMMAGDHEIVGGEARDDLVTCFGDNNLFFDARRAPTICGWPISFKRKDHAWLDLGRMIERDESADDRLLPNRETNTMPVLQRECGFFIWETEFFGFWPQGRNLAGCTTRTNKFNRSIEIIAAAFIRVAHCMG